MSSNKRMVLPLLYAALFHANSHSAPIQCPANVTLRPHSTAILTEWHVIAEAEVHELENVRFFDGDPEQEAELVPDESTVQRSVWNFVGDGKRHIWVACSYKATTLMLARQLPMSVRRCVSNYQRRGDDAPPGKVLDVQCD